MQVLSVPKLTTTIKDTSTKQLKKYSGNLWKGVYSVIIGAGPAHAVHFATYEFCKERFNKWIAYNTKLQLPNKNMIELPSHLIASAAAGAIATFSHDFLMTPFDGKLKDYRVNGWKIKSNCSFETANATTRFNLSISSRLCKKSVYE
jgi:solute carrier family 25 iron transporter 28/37